MHGDLQNASDEDAPNHIKIDDDDHNQPILKVPAYVPPLTILRRSTRERQSSTRYSQNECILLTDEWELESFE